VIKLTDADYKYLAPIAEACFRNSDYRYVDLLVESANPIGRRALVEMMFLIEEQVKLNTKETERLIKNLNKISEYLKEAAKEAKEKSPYVQTYLANVKEKLIYTKHILEKTGKTEDAERISKTINSIGAVINDFANGKLKPKQAVELVRNLCFRKIANIKSQILPEVAEEISKETVESVKVPEKAGIIKKFITFIKQTFRGAVEEDPEEYKMAVRIFNFFHKPWKDAYNKTKADNPEAGWFKKSWYILKDVIVTQKAMGPILTLTVCITILVMLMFSKTREYLIKAIRFIRRIVSAPFRYMWRGVKWLLAKMGLAKAKTESGENIETMQEVV